MNYENPIIPGFYSDPSICKKGTDYYIVTSSFEYFPGVPIFHSTDLINWEQIGHCLTRKSQLNLDNCPCSGGIFAPTIRFYKDKFYMITTVFLGKNSIKNFYVTANDPSEKWSEPICVDVIGIDPSFYFEDEKTYVQYSAFDENSSQINQVEIELETGKLIGKPKCISHGCGGRDVEGPHIFKKDDWYYLMTAEGGTREGHMVALSRSKSIWGTFEPYANNPILSNRNKGKEPIQCVGHADFIEDSNGKPWIVALGTRPFKHRTILGRETMLTPAYWSKDGWLNSEYGYMPLEITTEGNTVQHKNLKYSLNADNKSFPVQLASLRSDISSNVSLKNNFIEVKGNSYTLDDLASPTFLAFRQSSYNFETTLDLQFHSKDNKEKAGLALLIDNEHYIELVVTQKDNKKVILLRKKIADIIQENFYGIDANQDKISLKISGSKEKYYFFSQDLELGWTFTKHLSMECSFSAFTGVMIGLYVTGQNTAYISNFSYNILQ